MSTTRTQYATRIYGRDGLEYTGDTYRTLKQAVKGVRADIRSMMDAGICKEGADWHVHEWNGEYGEVVASSD